MKTHMNPEKALEGAMELEKFLAYISGTNPDLYDSIHADERLHFMMYALFTGLTPINRLKDGVRELKLQLNAAFKAFGTTRVIMVDIPECTKIERVRSEFLNVEAVRNVVEENREHFPEFDDPITWIQANPRVLCYECAEPGAEKHLIYGILSGFPAEACLDYLVFTQALAYLRSKGITQPAFVRDTGKLQGFYNSRAVALALAEKPEYLNVLTQAKTAGFSFYSCFVFSQMQYEYVKTLEAAFLASILV